MRHRGHEDSFELEMGNTSPNTRDTSSDSESPSAAAPPLRRNSKIPPVVLSEKRKWNHFVKLLPTNGANNTRNLGMPVKELKYFQQQ
jgi:hypothetical protein